ncbi:MAG TPA: NAD-dependent epimerase/dehydratase family protein [Chloroflexota bacterium]|nr:NAD-dependent epimerase/dehydratase family protein [Chloroflexota bacterium]
MRALVTGGAGFIGSHIVDLLVAENHDVAIVDNFATGKPANLNRYAHFYETDICSPDLHQIIAEVRPEVVFHQAAQMSVKVSTDDPLYDARVNVVGLLNVLEACVTGGVRKIIFASSGATYGNPVYLPIDEEHPQHPESPYGITKMVAEHYLNYYALDRGLSFTALRYGNVYGPRQDSRGEAGVVAIFARQLLSGQVPTIHWDGEQIRDYIYVTDVARANLAAATAGDGRIYCIGTGVGTSVNQIYQKLCEVIGVSVVPNRAPRRPGDLRTAYFDTRRAREELNWRPLVSLSDGLQSTVETVQQDLTLDLATTGAG